jgi:hypothetical protein
MITRSAPHQLVGDRFEYLQLGLLDMFVGDIEPTPRAERELLRWQRASRLIEAAHDVIARLRAQRVVISLLLRAA